MFYLSIAILFILFFFSILLNFYLISLLISSFFGAPYVPTEKKIIERILSFANLNKNKLFIELGCGDGRVVKKAVEKYHLRGVGVDINPYLILYLKVLNKLKRKSNPRFLYQDIFKTKLNKADYIYCFLMPKMLERLAKKFNRELKKGALIISHGFKIPNWEKKLVFTLKGRKFNTYYYRF